MSLLGNCRTNVPEGKTIDYKKSLPSTGDDLMFVVEKMVASEPRRPISD